MGVRTHTNETVMETHDGRHYPVRRRASHETARLRLIVSQGATKRLFTVERRLAGLDHLIVRIPVEAANGAEAGRVADEVKYALDYDGHRISHHGHPEPESWARNWPDVERVIR